MPKLRWFWRTVDPAYGYHRALAVVVVLAAGAAIAGMFALDYDWWLVVEVVATTTATWAVTRELDPDRESTAIIAATLGATWALFDQPVHILFMGGVLFAARIIVGSTGERPTRTELIMVAVGAAAISFTELGFIAGFALAVAIYIDNQSTGTPRADALVAAVGAAIGSAVIATISGAFPREVPDFQSMIVIISAVVTLLAVSWDPPRPTSQVDAPTKEFLSLRRLIGGRVVVAMACLAATLLGDLQAAAAVPFIGAIVLTMVSSEVERWTRSRLA